MAHPAVRLAKVVGVPGPEGGGTIAAAFVVTEDAAELGEDDALVRRHLGEFKVPAQVHVIDHMPTRSGTNGTTIRAAALREMAVQEQRRSGR